MRVCKNVFFRIYGLEKGYKGEMPHTYVDSSLSFKLDKSDQKRVAVMHGCLGKQFISKKSIPTKSLQFIIDCLLKNIDE